MQNTLMRLMRKKGLRRDPFQRLVTTAITPTEDDSEDDGNIVTENPGRFLNDKKLQSKDSGLFEGAKPPSSKQDPFLKSLRGGLSSKEASNLSPPSRKQNPLNRNLQGNNSGRFQGTSVPSVKQDPFLRQLQSGKFSTDTNLDGI